MPLANVTPAIVSVQTPPLEVIVPVTPPIVVFPLRVPVDDTVPETGRVELDCARVTAGTAASATSSPSTKRYRMSTPPVRKLKASK